MAVAMPSPPDDGHLKHPHLGTGQDSRAYTAAPEEHEQECAEELADEPLWDPLHQESHFGVSKRCVGLGLPGRKCSKWSNVAFMVGKAAVEAARASRTTVPSTSGAASARRLMSNWPLVTGLSSLSEISGIKSFRTKFTTAISPKRPEFG